MRNALTSADEDGSGQHELTRRTGVGHRPQAMSGHHRGLGACRADLAVTPIDYPRPCDPSAWSIDEASIPQYIVSKPERRG
jgi:hypothetical protein